ncbi:MAG: transposase [bacterium]|nr:transposase [bacterium]
MGQPASIAIVERFIRSMKQECTRCLLVPMSLAAMQRELGLYATWYNTVRPHTTLDGRTPHEVWTGGRIARRRRLEPRPKWPRGIRRRCGCGDRCDLMVNCVGGRKHLPGIELHRAA